MADDNPTPPIAPIAQVRPLELSRHGRTRTDDYAWLKDPDWQEVMKKPETLDKDIRAYLEAENDFTKSALADTEDLQSELLAEMRARIKEDDSTVPAPDGGFEYFIRYDTGGQHPIYCRRKTGSEETDILYHGDREAEGQSFFRIAGCAHSPNHQLLAFAVDLNGSERYQIGVRDLSSGEDLGDTIEDAKGDVEWANDGKTLFYTTLDDNFRPWRVYRHAIGDDQAKDEIVYEESDAGFFVGLGKTQSGRFIEISAHDHTTSEVRLIDADAPRSPPTTIAERDKDIEYSIAHHRDRVFILTNADDAEDFKIVEAPLTSPRRENWRDVIAHRPGCLITSLLEFSGYLVRLERIDGLPRIVVRDLASEAEHVIDFDEEAYALRLVPGHEFETAILRFTYSSMTTPQRTYDYDMAARSRVMRKQQEVPSGHDAKDYVTRRLFADSHDGEQVPITLLYRADTLLDGSAPLLLYGYGSYGMAMPAGFNTNRLSLVDRGFIYAIAHVRGGTEKGYGWYLAGKKMNKKNTFSDFIAAAEFLIKEGFTSAGQIAIHGGSAGGMLVGAVANMRPDLWGAVIAEVPFVDVLNTMSDADLPLTPPEWPEWGNPIEDQAAHDYIASYSPYDNVAAQAYPPILVTAGLTDPRVTYWEPAKWVAKLRALKTDDNLLLFRTNMEAGHAGAAGRFDRLEEVALSYGFLLKVLK